MFPWVGTCQCRFRRIGNQLVQVSPSCIALPRQHHFGQRCGPTLDCQHGLGNENLAFVGIADKRRRTLHRCDHRLPVGLVPRRRVAALRRQLCADAHVPLQERRSGYDHLRRRKFVFRGLKHRQALAVGDQIHGTARHFERPYAVFIDSHPPAKRGEPLHRLHPGQQGD